MVAQSKLLNSKYTVDIVLCIDSTGSMGNIIKRIKSNAIKFYEDLIAKMDEQNKNIDSLRIKVISFRDYFVDGEHAMKESDFFQLPQDKEAFTSFINTINAEGGGDEPESGLEALALAIKSEWTRISDRRRQIVVIWTDASVHPLEKNGKPDTYPKDMPISFDELTNLWEKQDFLDKRLIIYAPDVYAWTSIASNWENTLHFSSKGGDGLAEVEYNEILNQIARSVMLKVTPKKHPLVQTSGTTTHEGIQASIAMQRSLDEIVVTPSIDRIREWWHEILRDYGKYHCYAFFLLLPSDKEALKYLIDFGKELHLISGRNCLVIALSEGIIQRIGFDEQIWEYAINQHTKEGYSLAIAKKFKIKLTDFPCIVLFEDIRKSKHVIFSLKDKSSDDISKHTRTIFSEIDDSIKKNVSPITMLERYQGSEKLHQVKRSVQSNLSIFTKKTLETVMETWVNTIIK